jgi:hypothetical protein
VQIERDAHGTTFIIDEAPVVKTPGAQYRPGCPSIEMWWSRDGAKADETIIIRQQYPDRSTADVLELTQGQLYELLEAGAKLLESQ